MVDGAREAEPGLYGKYEILKDGEPIFGPAFVLRPDRDPAALDALRTYSYMTKSPTLRRDLRLLIRVIELEQQRSKQNARAAAGGRTK